MNAKEEYRRLVNLLKTRAEKMGDNITNVVIAQRLKISKNTVDNLIGNRNRVMKSHILDLVAAFPEYLSEEDLKEGHVNDVEETYGHKKAPAVGDQGELIELYRQTVADKQRIIELNSALVEDRLGVLAARQKAMIHQIAKVRSKLENQPFQHFVQETNIMILELSGVNS